MHFPKHLYLLLDRKPSSLPPPVLPMGPDPTPYALWIDSIVMTSEGTMIHWNALPGVSYLMEFSTDLDNWTSIPAHETDTWLDINAGGYRNMYYRVIEQ